MLEWKVIPGFNNYMVSSEGEVKSLNYHREGYEKILAPNIDKREGKGYKYLTLSSNGKTYTKRIHLLVMLTFKGEKENGRVINHINGIKTDNRLENLEYCTVSENNKHAFRTLGRKPNKTNLGKLGELSPLSKEVSQFDLNNNFIAMFVGQTEASRITGIRQSDISACVNGKQKTAKGYIWR